MQYVLALMLSVSAVAAITLPHANGTYGVASSQFLLVDHSREDPYAAALGLASDRRVMVSSFYPTGLLEDCSNYTAAYMPNKTAAFYEQEYAAYGVPNSTFSSLEIGLCRASTEFDHRHFPVMLFSPGLGNSRLLYNSMAQSLASPGLVVMTLDHPYDADIVEFPDQSYVMAANISTDEQIEFALDVRVADVSFVLDQLEESNVANALFGCHLRQKQKSPRTYAVAGHSLGGATAVAATLNDRRIAAAIDLDGSFFGSILSQGSQQPMLLVAHEGKNFSSDTSWAQTWNATQNTTKIAIALQETVHGSFTDFPIIVDALDIPEGLRDELTQVVGTMSGIQVQSIVDAVVKQFIAYSTCDSEDVLPGLNSTDGGGAYLLGKDLEKRQNC